MKSPILITGCARSGTSMTAGVVNICGAHGGHTSPATIYNKKGMFENADIRNDLVKPLLQTLGVDPMAQHPLPDVNLFKELDGAEWREKIEKIFKEQGVGEDDTWFYKGAKMCLMWPLWNAAFPDAKWIIVRRRSKEIVNSCMRTGFMKAFDKEEGWQGWILQHVERFNEMLHADLNLIEVWPQEMIDGQFSEMQSVIEWLDLEWKEAEVREFVAPSLWNEGKVVVNDKIIAEAFDKGRLG
ncbi:hypothetical protein HN682_10130 [Candidatus Peregrinibacteria bacterium]|nr:hypothetical protein [Candidatus Peregrinibacteria bacterium]